MKIYVLLLFLCLGFPSMAQGRKAQLHVTKVERPGKADKFSEGYSTVETKLWGYTNEIEYVLSCNELYKDGESKPDAPCAPMQAGETYEVKIFSTAIMYPPDQPNQPTYSWYMIREEKERPRTTQKRR